MHIFEYDDQGNRVLAGWLEMLLLVVVAFLGALALRRFVVDTYEVPTGSMLETIQLGDRIVGEKISYRFRIPQRGEIATFDDPERPGTTLIKRVIATSGQVIDLRDGVVYVDGEALDEPYVDGKPTEPIMRHAANLTTGISYPHTVAEGCVWMMGDNRTNSLDSRYFGDIKLSAISSHAVFIFWPIDQAGAL